MERHFEKDLSTLSSLILKMAGSVETAIANAVEALVNRDEALARSVIEADEQIDLLENEIDQLAMEILARYQVAARDLRFVATAMKITPDLERIGDHAVNVAERAIDLVREPPLGPVVDIPLMASRAQEMLRRALDAFVNRDSEAALAVLPLDNELDRRMESIFRELLSYMLEDTSSISRALRLTFVAKYFERIGDQATNIAEQVYYMVEGKVIKHPGAQRSKPPDEASVLDFTDVER